MTRHLYEKRFAAGYPAGWEAVRCDRGFPYQARRKNMPRATWNGAVVAESATFESVEGNVYFPPESIHKVHFEPSDTTSACPWKGTAHYYHVVVGGKTNRDAAWYYPDPKQAAAEIKDRVAFWRGVEVVDG
jgi:uncharacterized protein (DUF427 family)